jgi:hypothetical protein
VEIGKTMGLRMIPRGFSRSQTKGMLMRTTRLWVVLVLLGALPAHAYNSTGNEDRCQELGNACICSEPLNANDNLPAEPDRHWNPSDTTAKQCNGENGNGQFITMPSSYSESATIRASTERPFPSGANPFIYKGRLSSIHHGYFNALMNVDEETVCARAYRRYSNGARVTSSTERLKNLQLGRWSPAAHANIEHLHDGHSAYVTVVDGTYGLDGSKYDGDFQSKCSDVGWCRIEICADQSGSTLTYRYYITSLTTGVTNTYTWGPGNGPSSTFFDLPAMHMFTQGSISGFQYASHAMLARVPLNRNFRIGPAYELEGGSPGSPPPPPPPQTQPPAPPVLLP